MKWIENKARDDTLAVRKNAWDRIGDHKGALLRGTIRMFEAARLFNFTYVKLHPIDISDIAILEVLPFVSTDVVNNLELEKADYNIAASNADAGHDLWAFWHNNRLKLPFWYNVAKDIALIQPFSAFMERVFSTLRACLEERQETCYSDRNRASAFLKYNRVRFFLFFLSGTLFLVLLLCCIPLPCDIAVWLQFYCSSVNVERVRGPIVSLGGCRASRN